MEEGEWRPNKPQDEIFHVPQAQKYCEGKFQSWDPKITTPPGLYLVAWAFSLVTGSCTTSALRALNVSAICIISVQAYDLLRHINRRRHSYEKSTDAEQVPSEYEQQSFWLHAHSALNISLFPPLFFFSGLFYTDVMSTLFTLWSYDTFLKRRPGSLTAVDAWQAVLVGVAALFFRQTNIFWVAVFPAGLAIVSALEQNGVSSKGAPARIIVQTSWNEGSIYNLSVEDASLLG